MKHCLAILASLAFATPAFAQSRQINCDRPNAIERPVAPDQRGPFELSRVYCQAFPGHLAGRVSEDARSITYVSEEGVSILSLDEYGNPGDGVRPSLLRAPTAFVFSSVVWSTSREVVRPNGWFLGPLQIQRTVNGRTTPGPTFTHSAGNLDEIVWLNETIALAQFGTRGGFYRPERSDGDPTLAIVDTRIGRIRDTLRFADIAEHTYDRGLPYQYLRPSSAIVLPNRRVQALFAGKTLIVWTERAGIRVLPNPYDAWPNARFVLTHNGRHMLAAPALQAVGIICERNPNCPAPEPVEGVYAALLDADTGRALWELRETARLMGNRPQPAISSDSMWALIPVPERRAGERQVALVSIADGSIVQVFPVPSLYHPYAFGFARGGAVWMTSGGVTALYRRD